MCRTLGLGRTSSLCVTGPVEQRKHRVSPGRLIPCRRQFRDEFGVRRGDVVGLGGIGAHVVQFPPRLVDVRGIAVVQRQQLPPVAVEAAVPTELGVLLGVRRRRVPITEHVDDADSVALGGRQSVPGRRRRHSRQVEQGRSQIGDVGELSAHTGVVLAPRQTARPGDDERDTHATGERLPLVETERRVRRLPPPARIMDAELRRSDQFLVVRNVALPVRRHRAVHELAEVGAGPDRAALGRTAVVGGEHDYRVVEFAEVFEEVEYPADALVDAVDERRVHLLIPLVALLLLVGERLPGRGVVSGFGVAFGDRRIRVEEARRHLPREPPTPHLVPAVAVPTPMPREIVGLHLVGAVHGDVREVEEERFVGVVCPQSLDL